ncbi:c-type cytochrome [Rhodobium gokarnense]|uniref:Sulfide dehydrogenase cytochrome subunit n=1 Tax=Rhodobium gokarnense TaxID=364296 RepID=A0ABT3H842_9HYPH|nr:cytochrome c4 [Rhodobium gokarnense]MCW2306548.1 sulfide dehydrogenase cytochrome subunit [Rhodobium gokarnense]
MKARGILSSALAVMALVSVAGQAPAAELEASMLANTCNGCHGPNGTSYGPAAPTIGGTNAAYMFETMVAFREGERPSTIMQRIAKGYSDEELKLIADYFAKQPFGRVVDQNTDPDLVARGKQIYDNLCEDCHEDEGMSAIDYPALAGQMMPYLDHQLHDLISGRRDLEKNEALSSKERRKKMRNLKELVDTEGEDGVTAVIHFFGSKN